MTIAPGQDGGPAETHAGDQVVYVIEGEAILTIAGVEHRARPGACALIPAGTLHHVKNVGAGPLFFPPVDAPPAYYRGRSRRKTRSRPGPPAAPGWRPPPGGAAHACRGPR